jgi:ubiquinone/menaquinone biosynthesis C-methylase UbiE
LDDPAQKIESHYHREDLRDRLIRALEAAGKDTASLTTEDLSPLDEFHIRGREATLELARLAGFQRDSQVLDVGCGIGGPSRLLAQVCGCEVTGLDLTEEFCEAARLLAQRTGMGHRVTYHQGNALKMPFDEASFDGVWMQHLTMNIPDKIALFQEARRVLRPGGRLALYEIIKTSAGSLHYPVPWAKEPSISFVANKQEMRSALDAAGFQMDFWEDVTEPGAAWFRQMITRVRESGPPTLGLHVLVGPEMITMAGNVLRNIDEGHLQVMRAVGRRGP